MYAGSAEPARAPLSRRLPPPAAPPPPRPLPPAPPPPRARRLVRQLMNTKGQQLCKIEIDREGEREIRTAANECKCHMETESETETVYNILKG